VAVCYGDKMKEIQLTKGYITLIDDDDFYKIAQFKWQYNMGYAQAHMGNKTVYLHRYIMYASDGVLVDHINRNSLDNRKENLRFVTQSQNGMNREKYSNNTSGYKGVSWNPKRSRFAAHIQKDRKQLFLGWFKTAEEAYEVYKTAQKELHREYANG
jgi:hypothetical protein